MSLQELARVSATAVVVTTARPHRTARAAAEPASVSWQPLFVACGWTVCETLNDRDTGRVSVMKKVGAAALTTRVDA